MVRVFNAGIHYRKRRRSSVRLHSESMTPIAQDTHGLRHFTEQAGDRDRRLHFGNAEGQAVADHEMNNEKSEGGDV